MNKHIFISVLIVGLIFLVIFMYGTKESKEVVGLHPSWDVNEDGLNDCETDGSCDHTVDYTKPRPE